MKTLLSTLLIALCITAQAQITSTFDTDADGWTFIDATSITVNHQATNGNPGGYVSVTYSAATNTTTESWFAPAKFLGNQAVRSIDMNIRFDMQQSQAGTNSNNSGDIRIENGSSILLYSLPAKPAVAPAWSSYSLKLDETQGWRISSTTGPLATRTQIIAALSGITSIEIRGTYATNTTYTSAIDNVILEQKTLLIAPTITSFSPTSGNPGSSITINGNGFDAAAANNKVFFGSVAATITSASATQLTVTVPVGAQYEKLTIFNKTTGLTKQSDKPFNPTFTDGGRIIPASFDPAINLPAGSDYGASDAQDFLTVGDMDGDSWPDLISPDVGNRVLIYRNLGAGGNLTAASFSAKFSLTGAGNRPAMKVVDLDGDGKLDIVTAYYVSDPDAGFATYRNISTPGNLAFEPAEKWKGLAYSAILSSVVDVDGDGRADLIGRGTSGSVDLDFWIAQNISSPGNIEFGGSRSYFGNSINGLNPVTPADLDNDGKPEMIIVSGNIYIAKNNSTPGVISFETPLEIIENGIYGAIHVADFNLDGKNDLAWKAGFNSDDVHIRINTNAGAALAITDLATEVILDSDLFYYGAMSIADVNGDAKPDIIAADNADVGIFENVYSGGAFDSRAFVSAYQLQGISTLTYPTSPLVADLNGDSKPELILYNKNTSPEYISIYENRNVHTPAISFNTVSPLAAPVGATLTITGNYFSTVASENHVRIGGMYATVLTATKTQLTVQVPAGLTYGLVSVTRDQLTSTYRLPFKTTFSPGVSFNNTHFAPPVEFTLTSANYDIDAGDLNRDGRPDILAEGTGSYVFKNIHTTGPITSASLIADDTLSGSFMNPKLEDFDGDGYLDVIAVNGLYRKNNSTSTEISSLPNVGLGIGASNVDFADFNADGKIDMTLTSNGGGQLILLENRTTYDLANFTTGTFASFSQSITIAKPNVGGGVVTADFDNDGRMDVVATNPASDNISIFRNAGALKIDVTQFAARVDVTVSDNPGRIYKGDLDADGKMDLVMYYGTGANASLISVFHNTSAVGTISFSRFDLTMPSASTVAHIDDIDGDGKPEILVTSETGNRFSIFKNLHTTGALTAASFAAPFNTTVTAPRGLFTSDLNLDGKPEIIITRAAGLLVVYENLIPSIPPPTIISFNPTSGPVGTAVTITGTNFSATPASNTVAFNGTTAVVTASTTTSITTTVPTGATTGPITVTVAGNTATSSSNFTVTAGPAISITTQPSSVSVCNGVTTFFTTAATGTTNLLYQWQFSTTLAGTYTNINNGGGYSNAGTASISVNTTSNFGAGFYRCRITGDLAAPVFSNAVELTINAIPAAPTITDGFSCGPGTVMLSASGGTDGQYRWYTLATGGSAITGEVNATYSTPSLASSTNYYVSINNGNCESTRAEVKATILTPPTAPAIIAGSSCGPGTVTLVASGTTNGQYRWYDVPTGGTALAGEINNSFVTPALTTTTTYYVSINDGSCESTRMAVVASILSVPSKPSITSNEPITAGVVELCLNAITLSAPSGFTYTWSNGQTTQQITNVQPGNYSVIVKDASGCSSISSDVIQVVANNSCVNSAPVITTTTVITTIGGFVSIDLSAFISDPDNNLDPASLLVVGNATQRGGKTTLSGFILDIDYSGINFSGDDLFTIRICDQLNVCIEKQFAIEVIGDINVYNGISPNGDNKNDTWIIEYIDLFPDTQTNKVSLYNRWGDVVWEASNYDNNSVVFTGLNKNGSELSTGSYFYKIEFEGGRETVSGFLSLKR